MKKNTSALYIHIPFCIKKCKYCDFTSYCDLDLIDNYFKILKKEIILHADNWKDNIFDTIFIGGGTPSCVDEKYIAEVLETIKESLNLKLCEVTIEANPGTVDFHKLKNYFDMGINRISFGMQAVQDELLQKIGRIHTFSTAQESVALAKNAGFKNINIDLMSGLPMQSADHLIESVIKTSKMNINHISMYSLKLEEGTTLEREVSKGITKLPSKDDEYDMSKLARRKLKELGYNRYEISNYAKPGYECKHNLHYWHNDDYLGVGVSAASSLNGYRTTNVSSIEEYAKLVDGCSMLYQDKAQSGDEEFAFETLMLGLRLTYGINIIEYYIRHGIQLDKRFGKLIALLVERGLITFEDDILCLTDEGMDMQNSVLVEFMDGFDGVGI